MALVRLPEQVAKAVERAMKGDPPDRIRLRVRQALRDVLFLFHLHQQVNRTFLERERCFWAQGLALATGLNAMMRERNLRDQMQWNAMRVAMELPYPVDQETAAAIDAAKENYVLPWDVLEQGDEVTTWVIDYFVAQGKTALPEGAYKLVVHGLDDENVELHEEVQAAFDSEADYQKFLAQEDFSYGLADVPDAEFIAHYESIVSAMKGLGLDWQVVEFTTVPHAFLRDVPLVEGEWIDAYVVALAEWGARLIQKGYVLEEPHDVHPFACYQVVDPEDGSEVGIEIRERLWAQTKKHLAGFSGQTKEIGGQLFLSWTDYLKWRGRRAKGVLTTGLHQGLVISEWNRWLATEVNSVLDDVEVGGLDCHADGYHYQTYSDVADLAGELRRREKLLASLSAGKSGNNGDSRLRTKAETWVEMAEDYLGELYTLQLDFDSISQHYFDGQMGLFPASTYALSQLVEHAEKLVNTYNRDMAADLELLDLAVAGGNAQGSETRHTIDLSNLHGKTQEASTYQAAYLVDMAKAEALDMMGETEKAVQVVDKHI